MYVSELTSLHKGWGRDMTVCGKAAGPDTVCCKILCSHRAECKDTVLALHWDTMLCLHTVSKEYVNIVQDGNRDMTLRHDTMTVTCP